MPPQNPGAGRGYLPHCDTPGLLQYITFRLADSLPGEVLRRLMQEEIVGAPTSPSASIK